MPVPLKTPDITPAQIVAVAASIATELFNAALISGRVEQLVIGLAGILIPTVWILADAIIRHGRATRLHAGGVPLQVHQTTSGSGAV